MKNRVTVAGYRSRAVRESGRFVLRELGSGGVGEYRLRRQPGYVVLRHQSPDLEIFHELLVAGLYDGGEEVRRAMEGVAEPRVLDLGANIGLFGVRALGLWPGAHVTAFEPDPENLVVLERCIELNGGAERWRLEPAFASTSEGSERFVAGRQSLSRRAYAWESEGVTAVQRLDVMPLLAQSDVIKIDIEGAEWELLEHPAWTDARPRLVLLEYHRRPDDRQHELAEQGLEALGLQWQRVHRDEERGLGVMWGWRRDTG